MPGSHDWIAGANYASVAIQLIEDSNWHHYELEVEDPYPGQGVHIMIEDFKGSAGNAYSDNIRADPVPDADAKCLLLGMLLLLSAFNRRS